MRAAEGGLRDPAAEHHLQSCAECRANVEQWGEALRELAGLRRLPEPEAQSMCPETEELAAFCAGEKSGSEAILEHIAYCRRCAAIVAAALDDASPSPSPHLTTSSSDWRRTMAARFSAERPRPKRFPRLLPIAAALALAVGGVVWRLELQRERPSVLLARAYTSSRPFEYWMPDAGYSDVHQRRGSSSLIDRPAPLIDAESAARKMADSHPDDPSTLVFKGQVQLLELDYDEAIESLSRASEQLPRQGNILAALATAYAARGGASDLAHAVDLYLRAGKLDPKNIRNQFNLGLVFEKLSMVNEALAAFQKVVESTAPEPWRRQAEEHLEKLRKQQNLKKKADAGVLHDPAEFLARYGSGISFDAQEYIELFWSDWLAHSDSEDAFRASRLIAAQVSKRFGDSSLESTLLRASSLPAWPAVRLLAELIRHNRAGQAQKTLEAAPGAVELLDRDGLASAANRARVELAYALRWAGRNAECVAVTGEVKRRTPSSHVWLLNQARLEHSSCAAGLGRTDEARAEIKLSYDETSKAGLWPVALRAAGFLTAIDGYTGNYASVWEPALRGLSDYWRTSASIYRAQNFEFDLYNAAKLAGWRSAALVFYRAVMECSRAAGNREMEAWDRFGIAGLLHEDGDLQAELHELQAADQLVREMDAQSDIVDNLRWEARLRNAEAQAAASPTEALRNLQGLEQKRSHRTLAQQMRLWQARGLALFANSDLPGAAAAFQKAISLNQLEAGKIRSWVERIPVLDLAAASYRGLAQIQLQTLADPGAALKTWQGYRSETGDARGLTVTMALLPRGIVIWRSGEGATTVRWARETVDTVLPMAEALRRLCASPSSDEGQIRQVGARLYSDVLEPELRGISPGLVRVNADSWLAAIPLCALTDESGAYLGSKWSFVEAYGPPTVSATAASQAPIVRTSRALIMVAQSGQIPGGGQLPVLAAAMPEAQDVAARFSEGILKESSGSQRLQDLVPGAELFHFVGHGWANGGGGALLLASSYNAGSFVTARNLAALDWSHCRLAVLSACLTAAGVERGMVNNQSLVQALLSGGARRVVAARWSVDSEATRSLMEGFYDAVLRGAAAPRALALAEKAVAQRIPWRHPYYWAAFNVFGSV
jgi:tetratricopeptide (TPR) repeat protein